MFHSKNAKYKLMSQKDYASLPSAWVHDYKGDVTSASGNLELINNNAYPLADSGLETMSTTVTEESIRFMSAVRFNLREELGRMYDGWVE